MKVKWFYLQYVVYFNSITKIVCYSIFPIIGYKDIGFINYQSVSLVLV